MRRLERSLLLTCGVSASACMLSGCTQAKMQPVPVLPQDKDYDMALPPGAAVASPTPPPSVTGADDPARPVPAAQRMIIYSARLTMAVADIEASVQSTQKLAEQVQGYMVSMTGESITIRVPARQFFPVIEQLKALGQTISKDINAQDVTDEYVDLQLRLKNAEALRDRFVEILAKADNVKDTLEVERELNRVRGDIERMKGRLAQLDKQIAFSTIEVAFTKAQTTQARIRRPESPFPWLEELGVETVLGIRG